MRIFFELEMIGIFDSGIGGLSVFRELRRLLPKQKYIYYADSAHCPYGEKTRDYVIDRSRVITEFLIREGADIIVVACNTATAAAIGTLRAEYSDSSDSTVSSRVLTLSKGRTGHIRFIGMEPAVKPASEITKSGVVGVLATAGTLNGLKYKTTRERFAGNVKVVEHVGSGFVELVEKGITHGEEAVSTVKKSLLPLIEAGADTIVLGCTHYPFLIDTIKEVAGPGIRIIDPAPAVARHTMEVMKEESIMLEEADTELPDIRLFSSGDTAALEANFRMLV